MSVLSVVGAKGGCGVSLLATNLGVALAARTDCLLVDLNPVLGSNDLLLNVKTEKSWLDLLPVAGELRQRHLDLAAVPHPSGLHLIAAPEQRAGKVKQADLIRLLKALRERYTWVLLDVPVMTMDVTPAAFAATDLLLLLTTLDPQALRALQRLAAGLPQEFRRKTGLVFNQILSGHPAQPEAIAGSLELPLLATLPYDPRPIREQVNFGQPCVREGRSPYGRAVLKLAASLNALASGNREYEGELAREPSEGIPG
jgi:Flp pilus assembly CpaE family ATPase